MLLARYLQTLFSLIAGIFPARDCLMTKRRGTPSNVATSSGTSSLETISGVAGVGAAGTTVADLRDCLGAIHSALTWYVALRQISHWRSMAFG